MEVVGAEDRLMVDAEGVSAGRRVRRWRSFAEKRLIEPCAALNPVTISSGTQPANGAAEAAETCSGGAIQIEFAGRAIISVESGADPVLMGMIFETLCK
jgi:transposase